MITARKSVTARAVIKILVLHFFFLSHGAATAAQDVSGEQLLEALRTALQTGDKTGFATLLEGASIAALGFVNVKVAVLRREIAQAYAEGRITGPEAGNRMETLTDLQSRLAEEKRRLTGGHQDQGDEPFFGRFTSDVQLGSNLPPEVNLTLTEGSSFIVKPETLGGGIVNPAITDAKIGVQIGPEEFELSEFSFGLESFDINGMASGPNTVSMRPNTSGTFQFEPTTGEFQARYEGVLVNDLYPETNPILFFSDVTGFVMPDQSEVLVFTTEPMIVPGVPGEPPVDSLGMAYIPTIATFDPVSNELTFGDNLDSGLAQDVALVRTPEGMYVSDFGVVEPLIGATFLVDPLQFLGQQSMGPYLFADSRFSIFNPQGVFATGLLTGIHIEVKS